MCGEGFDAGPGKVDVEEEKESAEAGDGRLVEGRSVRMVIRGRRGIIRRIRHRRGQGG